MTTRHPRFAKTALATTVLSALLAALAVGCVGAPDDGAVGAEDNLRVKPNGSDLPGSLIIKAAPGATDLEGSFHAKTGDAVKLGEKLDNLPAGDGSFTLESYEGRARLPFDLAIAPNTTTTIIAAAVGMKAVGGPPTLGLGAFTASDPGISTDHHSGFGGVDQKSDGSRRHALIEGSYDVSFGLADGVSFTVSAGETKDIALWDTSERRVTRVTAPTRELPAAVCGFDRTEQWAISEKSTARGTLVTVKGGESIDLGISLKREGESYTLHAPIWRNVVDVPLAARGAGAKPWAIGRIDVDNVSVNGGPPSVVGRYAIYAADAKGERVGDNLLTCPPVTNSGVDMPPGHYRIETSYSTVEAGSKTDVQIVDL